VITTRDTTMDRVKARLAGASEYIVKPFTIQRLAMLVQRYLDDPTLILPAVRADNNAASERMPS
jgi:DNA-binding response OmpR family regulator